jgi:hypothetical protein
VLAYFLAFGCANEWVALDADGDGWTVGAGDCWDETALHGGLEGSEIHPEAPDVPYDGVDADCAGDDDFDHDGDGYVTSIWVDAVTEGVPSTLPGGDCWDDRDEIEQEFGALPGFPQLAAADVHPGADETWYDGIDANCDGAGDFDQDGDGHASTSYRDGAGSLGDDCFDALADPFENPAALAPADVHPAASDTCYDATDADCDGTSDWDCDGDGFLVDVDCDDTDSDARPGAIEVWYDGVDQDCDGNDADQDHDGYAVDDYAYDVKAPGIDEGDCWDAPELDVLSKNGLPQLQGADVHPFAIETWYDGIDADCDGHSDFDSDFDTYDAAGVEGSSGELDCVDANVAINPGVNENCDTDYDDDCDGDDNDIGADNCSPHFYDDDRDGYGSIAKAASCTCGLAPWDASTSDDCDDTKVSVHPNAIELVGNETDEDCDGQEICYLDADGDLFRTNEPETTISADSDCSDGSEAGVLETDGDCDDADVAINPIADEDCNNGIDENCDASSNDCPSLGELSIEKVAESSLDGAAASGFGHTIATGELGDDSTLDVAITAILSQTVYAFGGPLTVASLSDSLFAITDSGTAGFGDSLAVADLDDALGDDVVIGSPFADSNSGEVFLFSGPVSVNHVAGDADWILTGESNDDQLGVAVATGDWNDDGDADLAIGASTRNTGGSNSGALWIFLGPVDTSDSLNDADATQDGASEDDRAARSLASGDLDADGVDDIAVGVPGSDRGVSDGGGVYVVSGPIADGALDDTATYALYGTVTGSAAGTAVAVPGDLNGDGRPELLVGAPHASSSTGALDAGLAYLVLGDDLATADIEAVASGTMQGATGGLAGSAVGSAGDLDNDGRVDVSIGAPGNSRLAIFYVPPESVINLSDADLVLEGTGDELGTAFASVGHQNEDAIDDLIVGAPGETSGAGAAWILLGAGM